jgi:hypothetical protein
VGNIIYEYKYTIFTPYKWVIYFLYVYIKILTVMSFVRSGRLVVLLKNKHFWYVPGLDRNSNSPLFGQHIIHQVFAFLSINNYEKKG